MRTALLCGLIALAGCGEEKTSVPHDAMANAAGATRNLAIAVGTAPQEKASPAPPAHKAAASPSPKSLVPRETSRAKPVPADYRAIGTEPFWAVTVRGRVALLERPDKPPVRFPVTRSDDANAIRFQGEGFSMVAKQGPCSDGMSDAIWSDRVQIAFADGTLKGCGGIRDTMDAP